MHDDSDTGLGDWIEQLVAESTGKGGHGILPVVVPTNQAVNFSPSPPDGFLVVTSSASPPQASSGYSAAVEADLGAQFLLWEAAVAIAGAGIGINPFDQPDVESAKKAARTFLSYSGTEVTPPDVQTDGISAYDTNAASIEEAIANWTKRSLRRTSLRSMYRPGSKSFTSAAKVVS